MREIVETANKIGTECLLNENLLRIIKALQFLEVSKEKFWKSFFENYKILCCASNDYSSPKLANTASVIVLVKSGRFKF
jgi:hypothetical protein